MSSRRLVFTLGFIGVFFVAGNVLFSGDRQRLRAIKIERTQFQAELEAKNRKQIREDGDGVTSRG